MKKLITIILSLFTLLCSAQDLITPSKNNIEKNWIRNQSYRMQWFALRDTTKIQLGEVTTNVKLAKKTLTIVTNVEMRSSKTPWTDSTVARLADLSTIRHASYNAQRDMVLDFGNAITGFYKDKIKGTMTEVNEASKGSYFDSNIYPMLICWLPLKEGLQKQMRIYDYNPTGKIGIINAWVKNVRSGTYTTAKSGDIGVWIVSVTDEISSIPSSMTYYIAKSDRALWKLEIDAGERKMVMLRVE